MVLSLISSAQLPPDSLIKKYKIKKTVVTISAPYQKMIYETIYDKNGRSHIYKGIELDIDNDTLLFSSEEVSVYRDTFLIKQRLTGYDSEGKVTDSGLITYSYDNKLPYMLLIKTESQSNGSQKLEKYFYNNDNKLDSISFFSNDSSYSNGVPFGNKLFYISPKPFKSIKYFFDNNNELWQSVECPNHWPHLNTIDSIGCKKIVYSRNNDTLITYIARHYRRGVEYTEAKKLIKNGATIYEENEWGERIERVTVKDKGGLVIEESINYPEQPKWKTKITINYYFWQ